MSIKDRTTIMEPDEETIYPTMRITQHGIGELNIEFMAFTANDQIQFSHEITIRTPHPSPELFRGTLKELIGLVKSTKE